MGEKRKELGNGSSSGTMNHEDGIGTTLDSLRQ